MSEQQSSADSDEIASLRSRLAMAEGCAALAGINVDVHAIDIATLKSTMAKLIAAEKEIKRLRAEPQTAPTRDAIIEQCRLIAWDWYHKPLEMNRRIQSLKTEQCQADSSPQTVRGPDCACCEHRPRKDCTVPGCTMKDAEWSLPAPRTFSTQHSQAESAK
jgi:hypothetical protein